MSEWEQTQAGTIKVHSELNVVNALRKMGCVVRRNWSGGIFWCGLVLLLPLFLFRLSLL